MLDYYEKWMIPFLTFIISVTECPIAWFIHIFKFNPAFSFVVICMFFQSNCKRELDQFLDIKFDHKEKKGSKGIVTKAFQLKMFIKKSPYYPLGLYNFFDKDALEHIRASASFRLFKAASSFSQLKCCSGSWCPLHPHSL